jgi:hypothetical protein
MDRIRKKKLRKRHEIIWPGENTEKGNRVAIISCPIYAEKVIDNEFVSGII